MMKTLFNILNIAQMFAKRNDASEKPVTDGNLYLKIPLEEMQKLLSEQKASFDSIKATIRAVLSAGSLIISMVSALQIYTRSIVPEWAWLYGLGVISAAILYCALVTVCVAGLWPAHVKNPINADWDTLTTSYKGLNEQETIRKHLSAVLNAIELNGPILTRYKWLSVTALILLPLIVLILLLLTLVPRV